MEFISSFFSTPLWHFFDNPLCKNQKIRFIRSTRENIKKRHRNIEKKIRSLASGNVLTQGFFSPERKGKKNSAVSRKRRKRKFLQVSLLKKCKVGVRRDRAKSQKSFIYKGFRGFIFARDATVMLMGRKCLIFGDFLLLYDTVRFIRFYLLHYHL